VRGGFQPPELATVSTTSKPSTPAKGKPKADDKDTVETQRDGGFITVGPKRSSKLAQKARKKQNAARKIALANSKVPGSESFAHIDLIPKANPDQAVSSNTIIFPDDHRLATIKETTTAFRALFPENLLSSEDNLRCTNMEWGGSLDDTMCTNLISPPARYAVKQGLPLTTHHTKEVMSTGLDQPNAITYIENMAVVWGSRFPLHHAVERLGPNERFATELDENPKVTTDQRVSNATWVKALLVNAEVLHAQGLIPKPLTEVRAKLIVKVVGNRLDLDNANIRKNLPH